MNLKSGKASLTVDEVCRILDASARTGVSLLKLGDLHVEFGRKEPEPSRVPSPLRPDAIPAAEMAVLQLKEQNRSTELDELQLREDQIAELLLTDPLAAEEMIRNGDLEETNAGSDADDGFT